MTFFLVNADKRFDISSATLRFHNGCALRPSSNSPRCTLTHGQHRSKTGAWLVGLHGVCSGTSELPGYVYFGLLWYYWGRDGGLGE